MNPTSPLTTRQSNGELVRLLCMLLIVTHHFIVHALYPGTRTLEVQGTGWDNHLMLAIHCFFYIGVNCFVLLSGWYSIRLKPRSVINLWAICFFYALIWFAEKYFHEQVYGDIDIFSWDYLCKVFFPLSHTGLWFMNCYLALMLLSPVLNAAIGSLSKRQYQWAIVLSTVLCLWFGFFWEAQEMNSSGYSTLQFIWLYIIGGYLRRYCTVEWLQRHRRQMLWTYVGCSLLWGVIAMLQAYGIIQCDQWRPFTYCNPLVVGAAIGFFLFIMSFQFKSRAINWLAASVLAVYIVQESIFRYHWIGDIAGNWSSSFKAVILPILSITFMTVVLLADKLRILLMKPFWKLYDSHIEPRINNLLQLHKQ